MLVDSLGMNGRNRYFWKQESESPFWILACEVAPWGELRMNLRKEEIDSTVEYCVQISLTP